MRLLLLVVIGAVLMTVTERAVASPLPVPMRDAVDIYAQRYATYQGWEYVDRKNGRGDYRHAYFTMVFYTEYDGTDDGHPVKVPATWEIEAHAARCGPGWYVISTPDIPATCRNTTNNPLKW